MPSGWNCCVLMRQGKIVEAPVPERNGAHQDSEIHEAYGWGV